MKSILRSLTICLMTFHAMAQQVGQLVGAHSNGTKNVYSSININGGAYKEISVLNGPFNPVAGETTFDPINSRYFVKTGSNILILNALNGTRLDSITNAGSFYNIEYDQRSNNLVGMVQTGTVVTFKTYNLVTKIGTTTSTLTSVDSVIVGESTFDPVNRRYFSMTNLGMLVVDSNGVLVDVLCASSNLSGIEYDPIVNRIFYLEWNGVCYNFVSIEANSCNIVVPGTLNTVTTTVRGQSTFDKTAGHYFTRTNLGLTQIDKQNGIVLQTFPVVNNFSGMEFTSQAGTGIKEGLFEKEYSVFPNPSNNRFNFVGLKTGATLEIFDACGQSVFQTVLKDTSLVLDLEGEERGIYFYRIYSLSDIQQGKLILR